jgi:prevent-host-death family protein
MVRVVSATEARVHFGDVTRRVEERGEAVIVQRDGRDIVAIIPIDAYRKYEEACATERDWWEELQELHALIRAELGDRKLPPPEDILRELREERDAELLDLS